MPSFSKMIDDAVADAYKKAAPYTPSRAEFEQAFQPVLSHLERLEDPWKFIRATHRGAGRYDSFVSELFKQRIAKRG